MNREAFKGIYVLIIEAKGRIKVGGLGKQAFNGTYLYVGSARGPGGLSGRLAHHEAIAQGANKPKRWHIDCLLALGDLQKIFFAKTDRSMECALAQELAKRAEPVIAGFGSSDCCCKTHLFRMQDGNRNENDVIIIEALKALGLETEELNLTRKLFHHVFYF